jgi:hypothetical protein
VGWSFTALDAVLSRHAQMRLNLFGELGLAAFPPIPHVDLLLAKDVDILQYRL